ncbi:MAG TPA: choice-of-anchor Q domain-containing protein, partial [Rubrobacter sp.]|nr:choice-of-anchor Q domain-containing protein [Rubrobacter sp.]
LDSDNTCGFGTSNNSLSGVDPMLGPLADNGGPTETHALLEGSPAINKGNNAFAVDPDGNPLQFDQRGQGFARIVGGSVDIGAFEVQGIGSEPPPTGTPANKQECKKGGYKEFGFKNQGECIKAVKKAR